MVLLFRENRQQVTLNTNFCETKQRIPLLSVSGESEVHFTFELFVVLRQFIWNRHSFESMISIRYITFTVFSFLY